MLTQKRCNAFISAIANDNLHTPEKRNRAVAYIVQEAWAEQVVDSARRFNILFSQNMDRKLHYNIQQFQN